MARIKVVVSERRDTTWSFVAGSEIKLWTCSPFAQIDSRIPDSVVLMQFILSGTTEDTIIRSMTYGTDDWQKTIIPFGKTPGSMYDINNPSNVCSFARIILLPPPERPTVSLRIEGPFKTANLRGLATFRTDP